MLETSVRFASFEIFSLSNVTHVNNRFAASIDFSVAVLLKRHRNQQNILHRFRKMFALSIKAKISALKKDL